MFEIQYKTYGTWRTSEGLTHRDDLGGANYPIDGI
jgi:hypothetical protein